jgi:hypothetical protein
VCCCLWPFKGGRLKVGWPPRPQATFPLSRASSVRLCHSKHHQVPAIAIGPVAVDCHCRPRRNPVARQQRQQTGSGNSNM